MEDPIHIDVLGLDGELIASVILDLSSTVPHLRKTVADKIGVAPSQVTLQHGNSSICSSTQDGHGTSLIEVFGLTENSTVTAIKLAPRVYREFVGEFFIASTGYDEGFIFEVKVSGGTRADFDRLLDEARRGVQVALGLDHYFVPIVDMDGQRVLTPTETRGRYMVAASTVDFRLNASFDYDLNAVAGAVKQGLPCEAETISGMEVADGWLQVSVHATNIKCEKCNGNGVDQYGVNGPAGQTCTECLGTGFQKDRKHMQVVTVGSVDEMEVDVQDVFQDLEYNYALRREPIPGRPQMSGAEVLKLLLHASGNALKFKYKDHRIKPVLREAFGICARSASYETVFVGDHIFEMFSYWEDGSGDYRH